MSELQYKRRLKIGIIFNFNPSWMGGIIYIINLVKTLNYLDEKDKPEIFLFYNPSLKRFINEFDYPYFEDVEWNFIPTIKGSIKSWLLQRNLFIEDILKNYQLDAVFPLQDYPVKTDTKVKLISWTPDFQHKHYPGFFSRKIIIGRAIRLRNVARNNNDLVLSSHDAHSDLIKFFKIKNELKIHIYHFVSIIDNLKHLNVEVLRSKYRLPERYFFISNQFYKHKNHRIVFLAIAKLKDTGFRAHLTITGKLPEKSDSPYLMELHQIIDEYKLKDQISMLGFIGRNEQLQLMRHSQAVIQPSLFEGWSTVIEDAKSLQVPVIASSLNVNIEQLGDAGVFFDPHNHDELASILKNYPARNLDDKIYEDYEVRVKEAAKTLMSIFSK